MNVVRGVAALAALALSIGVSSASATTTAECQAQLEQLRSDTTAAAAAFVNTKDFESAVGKLDAAASKLAESKNADSIQKLADFQGLLERLATAAKPKLDPAVAESLAVEAQAVIGCIGGIAP